MRRLIAPAVLPLLALTACTGSERDPAARRATPPPTSRPAPTATTVQPVDRREIRDPGAMAVFGDVFSDRAAWASAPASNSRRFDRIVVADLPTGTTAVVVRSATEHLDWVQGHGDTVVYRELSAHPDDAETSGWAIKTYDLRTKARATIARSQRPGVNVPVPVISDKAIAWIEGEDGAQELRVYDRATSTTRTAFRSAEILSVDIDGGDLFFIDGTDERRPVLTAPIAGGEPTVLVADAQAIVLRVTPTHVGYARGPDPYSDPHGLDVYNRETRVGSEITNSTNGSFALGGAFIAWSPLGEDRYVVGPLQPAATTTVLQMSNPNTPLRLAADGDRLLWGESRLIPTSDPAVFTNRVFTARIIPV